MSLGETVVEVLEQNGIEIVSKGPNVARGNVNCQCPWCGKDDPSHHLGINLKTGYFGCWRDQQHRGKDPSRLVAAALNWDRAAARRALGMTGVDEQTVDIPKNKPFEETIKEALVSEEPIKVSTLVTTARPASERRFPFHKRSVRILSQLPDGVFRYIEPGGLSNVFGSYLVRRGFRHRLDEMVERYELTACLTGTFAQRILFPLTVGGEWAHFTARSIGEAQLRYKALSDKLARAPMRELVWNAERCSKGYALLITEGPFDALRIDWSAQLTGLSINAVALCTASLSSEKTGVLYNLSKRYRRVFVCLDRGFELQGLAIASVLGCETVKVPVAVKDLAELSHYEASRWCNKVLREKYP